jgi:hypothetical protein
MKNPIIAELRRVRDARARRHNFDIAALARDLTELEPWMEKKTFTLRNGRMVSVAATLSGKLRRGTERKSGVAK